MPAIIAIIMVSIFRSIQDLQAHGKLGSSGAWWNQDSWKLKWKEGNPALGERFIGSSTVFVWTTDAWHFFGMLRHVTMVLAVVFYEPIWWWWLDAIMFIILHNAVFEFFYRVSPMLFKGFIK